MDATRIGLVRRASRILALGALAVVPLGIGDDVEGAECPTECRNRINEVVCRETTITRDGEVIGREVWYWSDGAD